MKRHRDALAMLQAMPCNPSGITNSIMDACAEMRRDPNHKGTDELTGDPALRIMVMVLASLCEVLGAEPHMYTALVAECEREAYRPPSWPDHMTGATEQQRSGLFKVYLRPLSNPKPAWEDFALTASYDHVLKCIMVPWAGMFLGIEKDGYTHS